MQLQAIKNVLGFGGIQRGDDEPKIIENNGKERSLTAQEKILVDAEVARLEAEWQATQYQRDRAKQYPSFADQFDALFHGGYDAWKTMVQEVKDKYPKP